MADSPLDLADLFRTYRYEPDPNNEVVAQIAEAISEGSRLITIAGRAGTGKSTLIKHISHYCAERGLCIARVAPTGIAARNIDGETIHRFFRLDVRPYLPAMERAQTLRPLSAQQKRPIPGTGIPMALVDPYRRTQILIIDEASMVRCDILDECDCLLRNAKDSNQPFGGCLVLMFGDLGQLPPVASPNDQGILSLHYQAPFDFYQSDVVRANPPAAFELKTVYRQRDDPDFKRLLDFIRVDGLMPSTISELNERVREYQDWRLVNHFESQIICFNNHTASRYNAEILSYIELPEQVYDARYSGALEQSDFRAPQHLVLKVGAKVMFVRNSAGRDFVNGDIGSVVQLFSDSVDVEVRGEVVRVGMMTWEVFDYVYSEDERKVMAKWRGRIEQIPLRLAYAITAHKAQGQTYRSIYCDLTGGFEKGHEYVALSRATSLQGVTLLAPIES